MHHGYKFIHLKCIQSGLVVTQKTVLYLVILRSLSHIYPVNAMRFLRFLLRYFYVFCFFCQLRFIRLQNQKDQSKRHLSEHHMKKTPKMKACQCPGIIHQASIIRFFFFWALQNSFHNWRTFKSVSPPFHCRKWHWFQTGSGTVHPHCNACLGVWGEAESGSGSWGLYEAGRHWILTCLKSKHDHHKFHSGLPKKPFFWSQSKSTAKVSLVRSRRRGEIWVLSR